MRGAPFAAHPCRVWWTVRRTCIVLASIAVAGCNGSLSRSDGGTGAAASGGSGGTGAGGSGGSNVADSAVDGLSPQFRAQLDEAAAHWAATKSGCATYSYDRRRSSFSGSTVSTEVEIQGDVATRRRVSTGNSRTDAGGWTVVADETGSQIGQYTTGYPQPDPASTMEQLLAACETILAHDAADYFLTLNIATSGVPWVCTNSPRGCADDCESGIRIQSFACAALPPTHP